MSQLIHNETNGKYDKADACKDQDIPQDGSFSFSTCFEQTPPLPLPRYANDDKQDTTYCRNNFMKYMVHII